MASTQDQIARFMSGIKLEARAKVAGLPAAQTREEQRLYEHIDSQNTATNAAAAKAEPPKAPRGLINFPGAPRNLEDSGLLAAGFNFDDSQQAALRVLLRGRHVTLIGAAGTGKTTLVKHSIAQLIYGFEDVPGLGIRSLPGEQGPSIAIAAFTGIASQVVRQTLPAWLHPACKTIHSLLEYKPAGEGDKGMFVPTRNARNKLDHDIIVIDESSMLGLDLWHNLISAARPHTRFILIGDLNQLKPVADATFFAYALSAGLDNKDGWSLAELTTIHRQKEPAANKIIDAAHAILNGKQIVFDKPDDPDWRVLGFELPAQGSLAHDKIVGAINWLRQAPTPGDPTRPIFDPYADLLLTAGNGFDENDSAAFVQQDPLNGTLSRLIEKPSDEHPLFIIDGGRETRRFAVGHRVMATKNEAPDQKDRVTNGLTGRIIKIEPNQNWNGNRGMFGTEQEVLAWRKAHAQKMMAGGKSDASGINLAAFSLAEVDTSKMMAQKKDEEKQSSHVITIEYVNKAVRVYRTSADVASIRLAYAVTVHKAQGSQADTVVIVCHHAVKKQLSREWLYTGVTRAKRRVIILFTRMGLSTAIARQQIFGKNLAEKVNRYRTVMENGNAIVRLRAYDVLTEVDHDGGDDAE